MDAARVGIFLSVAACHQGNAAGPGSDVSPLQGLTLVSWNINRGLQTGQVVATLAAIKPDVVLLQEADLNTRRTNHRDVAADLARTLGMRHAFGPEFRELSQESPGSFAYQGQAVLAKRAIRLPRVLRFETQTRYWSPRWYVPNLAFFQRRVGGRIALIAEVDAANGSRLVLYNIHLESRGNETLRLKQVEEILADMQRYPAGAGIILAGDFNNRAISSPMISRLFEAGFRNAAPELGATTPRGKTIDWIFVRGPWSVAWGRVLQGVDASDHYPLVVRLLPKQ